MMLRRVFLLFGVIACLGVAVSFAIPLSSLDNKHNLSNLSNNTIKAQSIDNGGTEQICVFCHTPHSATPDSPLWGRPNPTKPSFNLYGNDLVIAGTLGADSVGQVARSGYTNDPATYPNGASRLCLSCHDGMTAIGLLNDNTTINMLGGTILTDFPSAASAVIELSTSHPISFKFNSAVLTDLNNYYVGTQYGLPDLTDAVDTPLDSQDRMQCTTCHDPHNDTFGAIGLPFWRQTSVVFTSEYEDVCNACHIGSGFPSPGPSGTHQIPVP